MKVPFVRPADQYRELEAQIDSAVKEVLASGRYVSGKKNEAFERSFAAYCGKRYGVSCANGTSALHVGLFGVEISQEGLVVVPVNTFFATAEAIRHVGAQPRFADIDEKTYTLDVNSIEDHPEIRAIIPVHLYGHPAKMDKITELAEKRGWAVLEDCAQAHGAEFQGKRVPVTSGAFSFYPTKNLGACGEGGMLVTDDDKMYQRALRLRDHGQSAKHVHQEVGYNYRLSELEAAILGKKLKKLDDWNERRSKIAQRYLDEINNPEISLPSADPETRHAFHLFVVRTKERSGFMSFLAEKGIETQVHYPIPIHLQPAFEYLGLRRGQFPVAENVAQEIVSLPLHAHMSADEVDAVIERVNRYKS